MSLSRLIARLFMVPIGLILAILAAGLFLSFALFAMEPMAGADPDARNVITLFSGVFLASILGSFAFYPAILGLIVAEFLSIRSLWLYLFAGLGLALFGLVGPSEPTDAITRALDIRTLAAGLVGGFTYWLVAGRGAGIVKRTLQNKPKDI